MAHNHPNLYRYFLHSNTTGFVASLSTILLLISEFPFTKRCYVWLLLGIMCLTITSMALTYAYCISVITPKQYREALSHTILVGVLVWCSVIAILVLVHTIRLIANNVGEKKGRCQALKRLHAMERLHTLGRAITGRE
ncbi:hypothetical protein Vadar_017530 [Vaccinium darrowii]|uniref:Uncharacterized protein n=1 Tax=Vaccinium darrowii TaxID=229202 RepID=A0ACB7XAF1_9ERIC|nr:hypothetical protein Vadar_017530 [Vaccinium darrowii]